MSPAEERGASSNGPRRRLRCLVLQPHSGQVHSHVEEGEGKREEDGRILLGFRTSIQQFSAAKKSYFYLDRTFSRNSRAESKIVKMRAKNLLFVNPCAVIPQCLMLQPSNIGEFVFNQSIHAFFHSCNAELVL